MRSPIVVKTRDSFQWGGVDILIRVGEDIVAPIALISEDIGTTATQPTVSAELGEEFLRACLNTAWDLGLRPDGYMDVRESMKATAAHLQDMRAIAFGKLNVEKPT